MASKKQLVQNEILAQATIAQPAAGFVSFGSKTTGLYQRLGAGVDEKLLVEADNLAPSILNKIKTVDGDGSGLDADLLDGKHASSAASNNTIVARDANGYIYGGYYNSNRGDENSSAASYIYDTGDGWMRKKAIGNVRNEIVTAADVLTKIKTVDGAGSGLDADLLDGYLHAPEIKRQINSVTNNLGAPSVEEMALFHGQFNNKLRFIPPISQEQSVDGVTWTPSTRATSDQLRDMMLGEGQGTGFIAVPTTVGSAGYYRLTWDTSSTGYVYLNALYVYNSCSGNSVTFTIDAYHNVNGWTRFSSGTVGNWPGHVYLPHSTIPFHPTGTGHYSKVTVTFSIASAANTNGFTLYAIEWFGGYPAGRRNVEYYDRDKNVTFPARIAGTRLAATVANGTSPMDITSQTLVTNLNVDLLDGYHGNVGAVINTYALRDGSADIACRLLRPNYANQATISGAMAFRVNNSSDNYVRFCSDIAAIKTYLQAASAKLVGSANIDSYLGDGLFEFDPVPTGTPPISSPNIRVLSIGREIRNTQMAFNYSTDQAWFRRKVDSVWSGWCEFYHSGNLSTLFTAIKTVDGHTSGLDADMLDGKHADEFALANIIVVQNAHGFIVGNCIKLSGSTWVKAKADSPANAGTVGLVSQVIDANSFKYITGGLLAGSYTGGANYFLSPDTAGLVFIQTDPEQWDIGNVREFIGTGTSAGLQIEIDLGTEITEAVIPTSIWELTGVDRTGWAEGKLLKFDASGNLIVGVDIQGTGGTGITLASLSAVSPIAYNSSTGAFSIAAGYVVPTTGQKANYDLAYGWGNHANAGYITAITKAMVEAVLTGAISSHTHNYDNYGSWNIVTEESGSAQNIASGGIVSFNNTEAIALSKVQSGNVAYMYATLRLGNLTTIVNPTTSHFIAIVSTSGLQSKITIAQLQGLIGGGGGGTTDHAALTNLAYDTSGHTGFARLAGSSSQAFAASTLTCASTATATNFILSDRRLKRKIEKLKSLDKFDRIKWHSFELKSEKGHQRCGVIAQELEEIAPEMVQENQDGMKMVNYIDLLVAKIARLEQRIEMLEGKINA